MPRKLPDPHFLVSTRNISSSSSTIPILHNIYPFELKVRQELLNETLFDAMYYNSHVDSIFDAKHAAISAAQALSPKCLFPDSFSDAQPSKFCYIL